MRLKDKVAIITGGSRGIGYATADAFVKEGATVILTASNQASADKAVAQLKEKYPDATVAGISPNLADLESVRSAFREATGKYGCVDILVNNAGVSESTPFMEYTEETFDKVMDLNIKGIFNASKAASEYMIENGKGVKIPVTAYETKGNRRKLTGAFSATSPVVGIFYEHKNKPFDILIISSADRALVVKSSYITQMTTRTSGGTTLLSLKKGQKVVSAITNFEEKYSDTKGYRKIKFPSPGTLLAEKDINVQQLKIEE